MIDKDKKEDAEIAWMLFWLAVLAGIVLAFDLIF